MIRRAATRNAPIVPLRVRAKTLHARPQSGAVPRSSAAGGQLAQRGPRLRFIWRICPLWPGHRPYQRPI